MLMKNKTWNCASYTRLSKEDKDSTISNSITNQKNLIKEYIESTPGIRLSLEIEDDGYSGVDFLRPGFQKLLEEIKLGNINCIVVKDLSRFGRNYLEVGDYLDKIFPFMGVRFIAINDNYDSNNERTSSDEVIIPFKNLMNETYLRDTSIKIRSQFEIKRKKGELVSAYAPFGYKKSETCKNKLVIDNKAATVVKEIFNKKIEGYSNQSIAKYLNSVGEITPYEYRKLNGEGYSTTFKKKLNTEWSATAIGRILSNDVYIGNLSQGKQMRPNHKIKRLVNKPKNEWITVENTHDPIIDKLRFEIVGNLLKVDTRLSPSTDKLACFSGLVRCADCGSQMVKKTVPSNGVKYNYLVCSGHKQYKNCSTHSISENKLETIILDIISKQVDLVVDYEIVVKSISSDTLIGKEISKIEENRKVCTEKLKITQSRKLSLYEDLKAEILTEEDYKKFNDIYNTQIKDYENVIENIKCEIKRKKDQNSVDLDWINYYKTHKGVSELSRKLVVSLIKGIEVQKQGIDVEFYFQDKIELLKELTRQGKGAVNG